MRGWILEALQFIPCAVFFGIVGVVANFVSEPMLLIAWVAASIWIALTGLIAGSLAVGLLSALVFSAVVVFILGVLFIIASGRALEAQEQFRAELE